MDQSLGLLSEFASELRYEDIPQHVRDKAKEVLVDTIGCAIGGRNCLGARIAHSLAPEPTRSAEKGVVIGRAGGYAVDLAAFMNTAMIRYLDFNDHLVAHHASDMLGALIAVTQLAQASGKDLLAGLVVAYEVHARVVATMREQQTIDRAYSIAIGAAAGVSNLLGLSESETRQAIAIATTSGVCLRASRAGSLSDYKGVASAESVRQAVFAALLASGGLTGPPAPFEGRHGMRELLSGEAGPLGLEAFGEWKTLLTCVKFWPVAYGIQPAIWAALEMRDAVTFSEVESVALRVAPFAWFESGSDREKWDPRTRETADHSLPYVFAKAYRDGGIDHTSFEPEAFRDVELLRFMQTITIEPDPEFGVLASDFVGVKAEVVGKGGTLASAEILHPRGHYSNPMSKAEIASKARQLMFPSLGAQTEASLEAFWNVDSLGSVGELFDKVVTPHPVASEA